MASPTGWTWVSASSGSWWWTGKPGMLPIHGVAKWHVWATELNWAEEFTVNFKEVSQIIKSGFTQPVRSDRCVQSPFRAFQGRIYLPRVPICPTDQQPGDLSVRRAEVLAGAEHLASGSNGWRLRWHFPTIPQSLPGGWGQHTYFFVSVQVTGTVAASLSGSSRNSQKLSLKERKPRSYTQGPGGPPSRQATAACIGRAALTLTQLCGVRNAFTASWGNFGKRGRACHTSPNPALCHPTTNHQTWSWLSLGRERASSQVRVGHNLAIEQQQDLNIKLS